MGIFPTSSYLELVAEAAFGADLTADPNTWVWTQLTCTNPSNSLQTISRLTATPVTISRGVTVGAARTSTTTASLELFNHDGAWTPELASSPHYPYIDVGTPIRLRARTTTDTLFSDLFTRTVASGWGTSTSGHTYTHSGTTAEYSTTGTVGRISLSAANLTRRATSTYTARDVDITFDCTPPATATGSSLTAGVQLRWTSANENVWCALEFKTAGTVSFRVWDVTAGVVTGAVDQPAGISYTAGQMTRCRIQLVGDRLRAKVWAAAGAEPAAWLTDVAYTGRNNAGSVGFIAWAQASNSNTYPVLMSFDNATLVQPPYDRLEGYITDVKPSFLPMTGGTCFSTVRVEVAGIGALSEKQQSPDYSPMRRSVQQASEIPIAYWPLEDEQGSTVAVSAFPGAAPMTVTGPAVFGFDAGTPTEQWLARYGTKPMVSVAAGARMSGVVPLSGVTTEYAVSFIGEFFAPGISPAVTALRVAQWETPSSTFNRWALIQPVAGGYIVRGYDDLNGVTADVVTYGSASFTRCTYTVEAQQSGGNILVELFVDDIFLTNGTVAGTIGPVTRVTLNPDRVNTTASTDVYGIKFVVGHVRVLDETFTHDTPYYTPTETGVQVTASTAWYREPAHRRLERLCQEERVPFMLVGAPGLAGSTILGAQRDGGFTDLITQAAESESGGLLYEQRFGYAYLPRSQRYNQPAVLTIDMAQYGRSDETQPDEVLVPELDSRRANHWTITRNGGASGQWAADAAYRKRRGTIPEEKTLDVLTDDVVTDHAGWRTHVNVDGKSVNYPGMQVDLAANPDLIDAYLGCRIGSRVQRINQPTIAGVGVVDQVIEGVTETLSPGGWLAELNVSPAVVWDVGVWDSPASLYAPSSTTVTTGFNSTAMSFVMGGEPWATGALSLLLEIDGEHILTSNITGSGNGPYTVTLAQRSVNGRVVSHLAGAAVNMAYPTRWAL